MHNIGPVYDQYLGLESRCKLGSLDDRMLPEIVQALYLVTRCAFLFQYRNIAKKCPIALIMGLTLTALKKRRFYAGEM